MVTDTPHFRCACCKLSRATNSRPTEFNNYTEQTICRECIEHRGVDDRMRVRRAVEHEAELRRRWEAAREAANDLDRKQKAAFRSRDRAVRKLKAVRDLHEYTGTRGACRCGVKNCKTLTYLEDPWVRDRINDLRDREYDGREWEPDSEEWEPFGINPPRPEGGSLRDAS